MQRPEEKEFKLRSLHGCELHELVVPASFTPLNVSVLYITIHYSRARNDLFEREISESFYIYFS
jgi:hypothetical protein